MAFVGTNAGGMALPGCCGVFGTKGDPIGPPSCLVEFVAPKGGTLGAIGWPGTLFIGSGEEGMRGCAGILLGGRGDGGPPNGPAAFDAAKLGGLISGVNRGVTAGGCMIGGACMLPMLLILLMSPSGGLGYAGLPWGAEAA